MDFSFDGGNTWSSDEISSSNPINYGTTDIFMTHPKINEQLRWPVHKYPNPTIKQQLQLPPQASQAPLLQKNEGFSDGTDLQLTENMVIILLLVILVVMCTVIYSTVKQTTETLKLITSMLIANQK